jgi:hypothetical protein
MASIGCPRVPWIVPCRAALALLDWASPPPGPPPGPPPLGWLEPFEPLRVATSGWRSRGTASMAPTTMASAAVAASAGRIHTLGDRSCEGRLE